MAGVPIEYFDNTYYENFRAFLDRQLKEELDYLEKNILPDGAFVLDAGCGYGRHTVGLARRGYRVIGVDASPEMIMLARERAENADMEIDFKLGRIEDFKLKEPADAALLLFSILGYSTEEVDRKMLANLAENIKVGGLLVLDGRNPEPLRGITKDKPKVSGMEMHWLEGKDWHMIHKHEGVETHLVQRLYTPAEITEILQGVGMTVELVTTGYENREFSKKSDKYMIVARKN